MNQYFGLLYKFNIDKEFKFFKHKNDVKQRFPAFLPPIGCQAYSVHGIKGGHWLWESMCPIYDRIESSFDTIIYKVWTFVKFSFFYMRLSHLKSNRNYSKITHVMIIFYAQRLGAT